MFEDVCACFELSCSGNVQPRLHQGGTPTAIATATPHSVTAMHFLWEALVRLFFDHHVSSQVVAVLFSLAILYYLPLVRGLFGGTVLCPCRCAAVAGVRLVPLVIPC